MECPEQQKKIEKQAEIRLQVILSTFYLDFTPSARGKPLRFYWSTHSKLQIAESGDYSMESNSEEYKTLVIVVILKFSNTKIYKTKSCPYHLFFSIQLKKFRM